ncbi:MAG: radical SAM protein [Rhodobacteraceae bacterium]|nr:radical SAM protein [Paracoccaceae bacterium]
MAEAFDINYPSQTADKPQKSDNWYRTPQGKGRGYIDSDHLRELWFHTGTACNLACDFCLEGSKPGDTRLDLVKFDDVAPYIWEALELGVEQFSFTGGEPFLAKDLPKILQLAASHRPCLVLTNGTEAVQRRIAELEPLRTSAHPVSFRVSLDHPEATTHDLGRGAGNFAKALLGLKILHDKGFAVSVARHIWPGEDKAVVEAAFAQLFVDHGLPADLILVAFPDFALPGSLPEVPHVTTDCMTRYQTETSRKDFMCGFSRMIVKQDGRMRTYACTLVDDDPEYDLGPSLTDSMAERISLKHHRCYSCFAYGSSCSEM